MHQLAITIALLAVLVAVESSADEVLFDNQAGVDHAYNSDSGSSNQILAESFLLANDSVVEQITWTGVYGNFLTEDFFTIDLFEDAGGLPGDTLLFSLDIDSLTRESTGKFVEIDQQDFLLYEYRADIDTQMLLAGDYWLSIVNDTPGAFWSWGAEFGVDEFAFRFGEKNAWDLFPGKLDFQIIGTAIPEPSCFFPLICSLFLFPRVRATAERRN